MITNEDRWLWLQRKKCNSLHLTRDEDHACNYVTAKQWIEDYSPEDFEDCPASEIQHMKDTNTIWRLQVYPNTPIGFYVFFGATLESVVDQAILADKE